MNKYMNLNEEIQRIKEMHNKACKINESPSQRFLQTYILDAEHTIETLFKQASIGYGAGEAIGVIVGVLKAKIPEQYFKFLPDAINKAIAERIEPELEKGQEIITSDEEQTLPDNNNF